MRANHDSGDEPPPAGSVGVLQELALHYQAAHSAWAQEAEHDAREHLRQIMIGTLVAIEEALHEPMRREAHRWRRSRSFREIKESLTAQEGYEHAVDRFACQLFLHVLEKLDQLQISYHHDMIGLLVVIARRGMAREERRIYKPPHIRTKQGAAPLPMLRIGVARDEESEPALDVADEHSAQDMDRVLTRVAQQPIRDAINKALAAIHAPEDCVILMARLIADPPQPYEAIAERLGAGWTAAAVRQRYRRARLQLQEILKDDADHWY